MEWLKWIEQELFSLGEMTVSVGQLLQIALIVGFLSVLGYLILSRWLPRFYGRDDTSSQLRPRARRVILSAVIIFSIIAILRTLELDFHLLPEALAEQYNLTIRISTLMKFLLILVTSGLVDWSVEEFLIQRYHQNSQEGQDVPEAQNDIAKRVSNAVSPVVYTIALILIAKDIGIANYLLYTFGAEDHIIELRVERVLAAFLVFFMIRLLILLVTRFALAGYYNRNKVDSGSQYALDRLLTYFAYFVGILLVLQTAGFSLFGIWTGAAALLVGIGIGLQQTFNDLICGIIILFERSVKVGDVLDMGGPDRVGTVHKIGTRTSQVETRDGILMYVPNSKLIGESVVNWSQTERKARFHILVGVAYGSDTELVRKILLKVAEDHPRVMKLPGPNVRFVDFGSSSLDFDLMIMTRDFLRVEDTRSDLRFAIDAAFRKNKVEIPFPQQDLWIRGGLERIGDGGREKDGGQVEALPEE